ncbi:hypothetical protein TNCV_2339891 [Trichonephila clavipes]|nr:hypothetical protein TNCV_2339891 [Trichonephila clavipes]
MANNQSVRRHLDAFTRGRIIGKLEEGRSVTSVWLQSSNCSQHRFTTLETISNYRNSYRGSVVVVHEEPHPQITGTLSYRPEEIGGRQREKSLDTRHRQTLGSSYLPPVTIRQLRLALQDEWAAMPQQLIDTLILSMGRRCETCLAVREIISY